MGKAAQNSGWRQIGEKSPLSARAELALSAFCEPMFFDVLRGRRPRHLVAPGLAARDFEALPTFVEAEAR